MINLNLLINETPSAEAENFNSTLSPSSKNVADVTMPVFFALLAQQELIKRKINPSLIFRHFTHQPPKLVETNSIAQPQSPRLNNAHQPQPEAPVLSQPQPPKLVETNSIAQPQPSPMQNDSPQGQSAEAAQIQAQSSPILNIVPEVLSEPHGSIQAQAPKLNDDPYAESCQKIENFCGAIFTRVGSRCDAVKQCATECVDKLDELAGYDLLFDNTNSSGPERQTMEDPVVNERTPLLQNSKSQYSE